ncbi:MAG TPA: sodium/solute symporter [Spirochaetota bacterium]|nr:sodium/solute symporter [Spirochaetota bacterium]
MKKTTTLNDFFLGGRSIGPWISAFAYGTSYFSAVLFIGFAGKLGWGFGLNVLWISLGNTLFGALLAWLILGRRTRRMTQNLEVMTMPEFLQERFQGKYIKIFSAIIIFTFLIPYSASVFKGLGHLFEINFNISYDIALMIMIAITGIYLILGGYFAITLTDFIQGIIMLFGSVAMVTILIGKAGGLSSSISAIIQNYPMHIPLAKQPNMILLISLVFMTSFGAWGMPQMVQKFYAIKNEKMIGVAAIVTTVFAVIIVFAAYFTGALTHIFYSPETLPMGAKGIAFDKIIPDMLKANLPEYLMALILLLVLSASMSTLSSLVLVSSSSVAIDLYKGHINPNISKSNSLVMMRFLSGIFIVISYFIARYDFGIIVTLMSLSWGAVSGSFMAAFVYGLYYKGATKIGIASGMATGLVLSIVLFFVLGPANSPIASSIAIIVPFFVIPVVSLFTKKVDKEILDKAFQNI